MSVPPDQMPPTTPPPDSVPPGPPPPDSPPPGAPSGSPPPAAGAPSPEERQWAMFAHLSSLIGGLLTSVMGGGWGCVIGPLIIWLVKKDTMPFVDDQGKEALNFNITVAIAGFISWILLFVLIGFLLLPLVAIFWLVFTIIASIKANEGVAYRYPVCLRLFK